MSKQELVSRDLPKVSATPPYAWVRHTPRVLLQQYKVVLLAFLASYRTQWVMYIIAGILAPLGLILFARSILGGTTPQQAIFLLGGNMALSIILGPTTFLIAWLGAAKESKEFDYWIMLPVPKYVVVLAIISVAVIFAFPGLAGTYILGVLLLGLPFSGGWSLIFLALLSALSIAGLGVLLGYSVPNPQAANVVSNLLILVVAFLSPIMIPADALPLPLRIISWIMPSTYAADAFRSVLAGDVGPGLVVDIIFLTLSSVLLLSLAQWNLRWRSA